ncbi:MAG: glycoside hydrolase, partial [Micromonosporaceae bacterium]|nr:glycoside hydrolase [Micromonosporaceae bacterium]
MPRYSSAVSKKRAPLLFGAHLLTVLCLGGLVAGCSPGERAEGSGATLVEGMDVTSWVYQLQDYPGGRLHRIQESPHQLAVIDLARDGSSDYFRRDEIAALQRSGKRVLAYFEIGSIEDFRPEYEDVKSHDLVLNKWDDWPEEHFVRYWKQAWWDLAVKPRVDRALAAGFDGVYLDTPLAYEEIDLSLVPGETRDSLGRKMVDLIVEISRYAKRAEPGFWVLPQNSPELAEHGGYTEAIDGIGMEDLFFRSTADDSDIPCLEDWCAENLEGARELRDAGKLVLAVDYASKSENIEHACRRYREERFVGYVT